MSAPKIKRKEAIDRIAEVFLRYGHDGTSLREISKATGLGRASLYHHFPGGKDNPVPGTSGLPSLRTLTREGFQVLTSESDPAELIVHTPRGHLPRNHANRTSLSPRRDRYSNAGLVFIELGSGDVLQMTGRAELRFDLEDRDESFT